MPPKEPNIMLEGMSDKQRTAFLEEMSAAYKQSGVDAEERRAAAEEAKDEHEERAWRNVAIHCEMMSALVLRGILDEPPNRLSFYSYDERIGDKRLLLDIMADVEQGKTTTWTTAHQSVVGAALWRLTPKQREIAELYFIARVPRKSLPEMMHMPLSTVDTHIRDVNREWRAFAGDVEDGEPIQASWLGHFHEVTEMSDEGRVQ